MKQNQSVHNIQNSKLRKRIFLSPPHMNGDELRFVEDAFDSNYIAPLGPQVDLFEKEFAEKVGISYAVAVASGTAAMHLALRFIDIKPGDEVFASTMTFIGSVSPIVFEGATPVFIDSDRLSWNMDPNRLESELKRCADRGNLPKAVIPTDLYGQCCDYDRIFSICSRFEIPVIVDAAEAMGAKYFAKQNEEVGKWVHAGVGARAAVYSFNGNKILTASAGGMLASEDMELIEQARFLSQQARDPFIHYEHSEIGYNYRMSNILAAIGRGQLKNLEDRVKRKYEVFNLYKTALENVPGIEFMPEAEFGRSNKWLTVILVTPGAFGADREQVRLALEAENIESRPVWKPMHLQPVFQIAEHRVKGVWCKDRNIKKRYQARVVGGEVAEDLFDRGLCLPSGTAMTDEDIYRVISVILKSSNR